MSRSMNEMRNKRSTIKETSTAHYLTNLIKVNILPFLKNEVLAPWSQSLKGLEICYCLEIDSDNIRLSKIESKNGKLHRITSHAEPLPKGGSDEVENLSLTLTSLLSKAQYRGEEMYASLSSNHDILNKVVEVESEGSQSAQEWIIANREEIFPPVDEEEIVFDYFLVSEEDKNKCIYFSICRRETINRLLQIFKKHHLNLMSLIPGCVGVHHFLKEKNVLENNTEIMVILFQDESAEVTLYQNSKPVYITQIPHRFQSASSHDRERQFRMETDEFAGILKRLLNSFYAETYSARDVKLLLLGAEELTDLLGMAFRKNGLDLVGHSDLIKLQAPDRREFIPFVKLLASFCTSAKREGKSGIDFLPPTRWGGFLNIKPLRKIFNFSLKACASLLLVFGLLNLGFLVYELGNKEKLEGFESKIMILNDLDERNRILTDELEDLEDLQANRSRISKLLFTISEIMPEQIWLRDIKAQGIQESSKLLSNRIEIAGLSVSKKAVTELLSNLEKSEYFTNVQIEFLDKVPSQKVAKIPRKYRKSIFRFKMNFVSEL